MRMAMIAIIGMLVWSLFVAPAFAWNNKGHMVVARLAWLKMSPQQRAKVSQILRNHPDYDNALKPGNPASLTEEEWVFMKAATWPDWVKSHPPHHPNPDSHPTWHYIDKALVAVGSNVTPPPTPSVNAVTELTRMLADFPNQSGADAAKTVCWVLHLVGDLHQPLHCTSRYSDRFPTGDRGGNLALIMINGHTAKLHPMWDGLLGSSASGSSVLGTVQEIKQLAESNPNVIADDLTNHTTIDSWAEEGFDNAKKFAYWDGAFEPANAGNHADEEEAPDAPSGYATTAGQVARVCVAKAGQRLAQTLTEMTE